jgi:glycerol uptake facilitator-like aquaporin
MGAVSSEPVTLWRRVTAEFLGSGFLAAVVIGSGIAAQRLSPGATGLFTDTFAGIAPSSVPSFIAAQVTGGILAAGAIKALYPAMTPADAADIIFPHHGDAGQAPARAAHDGASPSADRPPGPVRSH